MTLTDTRPSEPFVEAKARIAAAVEANRDEILELSHRIHEHPETAFEEHRAAGWVADAIRRHGFEVEAPVGGLATAVRGRLAGGRADGPRIAILAEYDALPGLGHGCGHNTMAASGVGAAIALASIADQLSGEITFIGTPAEERGSGKAVLIEAGVFDGLDAALLYHPCDRNHVLSYPLASEDVHVTFRGLQAHAASDPWKGRNALDAMVVLFTSIGLWRQQLPVDALVHGVIQEGGTAANIIPDRTVAWFMLRSANPETYRVIRDRFEAIAQAAAQATDTSVEIEFSGGSTVMRNNGVLAARWMANAEAYGVADQGPDSQSGSTDMGNVSQVMPAIHPDLAIAPEGTPGHSLRFREAAAGPQADETTLLAATLVAQTAYDLFADPSLVRAAWEEFRAGDVR
ncbi:MAG: M20 family metallopeptidase [Chloroflexota bacterium]